MKHILSILLLTTGAVSAQIQTWPRSEPAGFTTRAVAQNDTIRVNALIIDTAVVFYPGPRCDGCMIGNGKPTPVAVARDILVVTVIAQTTRYDGMPLSGHTQYYYFELNGQPIDERRVFIYKQ